MKLTVIGTGYVGLVTGACFAEVGHDVVCLDIDQNKIDRLNQGEIPIYEPGLEPIVHKNHADGRLAFTTDTAEAVAHGKLQFIAVGTPPGEDGSADLQYVLAVARDIGTHMNEFKVVINKSTVPVGTACKVRETVRQTLKQRGSDLDFDVVSNPEFLKEGHAVEDFMRPDRIVIGTENGQSIKLMREAYTPLNRNHDRLMVMRTRSAEMTKYAANAMLATRISFMNELANLADVLDADIDEVRRGIGSDTRIGYDFLYAGCGFGGSCFPKDVRALNQTAQQTTGKPLEILKSVESINQSQKRVLFDKMNDYFGGKLKGRTIALWGLSFKPNTDDMREATSLVLIDLLTQAGARIRAFDPVAMEAASKILKDNRNIEFVTSAMSATKQADALMIVTEWSEFKAPDFDRIKQTLNQPVIFDGRNLFDPEEMAAAGFHYQGIGRRIRSTENPTKKIQAV
jgi:UDPglucose 6-dehydrogenase